MDEIIEAAKKSNIAEFIKNLPQVMKRQLHSIERINFSRVSQKCSNEIRFFKPLKHLNEPDNFKTSFQL